uniref:FAR1 domain-containing protein n=1 Tax=Lactuca sativa TaxID=4236 RepID=A0A9R1V9B5_LACSA|nr:hypothetical protein LSAT_V11C600341190 [Lactuca sativa]
MRNNAMIRNCFVKLSILKEWNNKCQNVKEFKVNQDLKNKRRCEICFDVDHDKRSCPHVRDGPIALEDSIDTAFSNPLVLSRAVNYLWMTQYQPVMIIFMINMNILIPIDYADDDENFGLADHDSLHNIDFEIGENSNLNLDAENENEFIDDKADDTIVDDNIDLQKERTHVTHDYLSSGGSPYWIPVVSDHIKPKINSTVDSCGVALSMYKNYASEASFDVRFGTIRTIKSNIITQRHLLCNREDSIRCEYKAKFVFILLNGTNKYIVDDFVEQHTHELFGKDNMFLSRTKRKLDYSQKMFIHNLSKQKYWCLKSILSVTTHTSITGKSKSSEPMSLAIILGSTKSLKQNGVRASF